MEKTPLGTTLLGKTGLDITRVGFGAWAIGGGGWEFGWGPQDNDNPGAAIHRALELGVNWIDTGAAYGFGRSEEVVGRALHGLGDDERPYVFTNASLIEGHGRTVVHNLKRDSIVRGGGQPETARTRRHRPVPDPLADPGGRRRGGLDGVRRPQGSGLGPPHRRLQLQRRAAPADPADRPGGDAPAAVLADRPRGRGQAAPFAGREAMGVIVYSPMASGLLTGAMTRERIAGLPDDDWRKHDPAVHGAIVGFRRPDQVEPLVGAANLRLDDTDLATIERTAWR
jgi:aryl-alcohol dehydrogenase-like predicted oxidoreductase